MVVAENVASKEIAREYVFVRFSTCANEAVNVCGYYTTRTLYRLVSCFTRIYVSVGFKCFSG